VLRPPSYYVPAENGSLAPGVCQFIWVWYQMLPEGEELEEILTDCSGRKHLTTLPRGQMRKEVWEKTLHRAGKLLNPPFVDLLERTQDPFFSAIRHFKSPKSVLKEGKVLLVGDALTLYRPHAAASTNQAARQAMSLAEVLEGNITLAEWEKNALDYANRYTAISNAFGEYCFTGVVPPLLRAVIPSEE
jgi:2-polyprenyl-6-methoxyphenol hydroxylase-like FAD-dependent oxidoreductase